jgi:prevent-host-death family protein
MSRRVTTAEARRDWAKVLRSTERGTVVEVLRNGQPVAAVISIEQYRAIEGATKETLASVVAGFRSSVDPRDLEGPDFGLDERELRSKL